LLLNGGVCAGKNAANTFFKDSLVWCFIVYSQLFIQTCICSLLPVSILTCLIFSLNHFGHLNLRTHGQWIFCLWWLFKWPKW
jgi:hypothetical protein